MRIMILKIILVIIFYRKGAVYIMRNAVINKSLLFIKANSTYDDEKLAEIKYGLESIYILITKTIIILSVAFILGIFKEVVIFSLLYSLIRMPSFGLHATKSWICLVSSLSIFLIFPVICKFITIPNYIKCIISIINIIFILKNAPADTYKRPIINKKRRERYKLLSVIIASVMCISSYFIKDNFISNAVILSVFVQLFMISPFIYKIFGLPYNNYKKYINKGLN